MKDLLLLVTHYNNLIPFFSFLLLVFWNAAAHLRAFYSMSLISVVSIKLQLLRCLANLSLLLLLFTDFLQFIYLWLVFSILFYNTWVTSLNRPQLLSAAASQLSIAFQHLHHHHRHPCMLDELSTRRVWCPAVNVCCSACHGHRAVVSDKEQVVSYVVEFPCGHLCVLGCVIGVHWSFCALIKNFPERCFVCRSFHSKTWLWF